MLDVIFSDECQAVWTNAHLKLSRLVQLSDQVARTLLAFGHKLAVSARTPPKKAH